MDNEHEKESREFERLKSHIDAGLEKIRNRQYREASEHFSDKKVAENCGLQYETNNLLIVTHKDLSDSESIKRLADRLAWRSWFWSKNQKTICPSRFFPEEGLTLPPDLLLEETLILAEEWIHALQSLRGGPLSKGVSKTEPEWSEKDVALYLKEHRVEMTEFFLKRYQAREAIFKESLTTPFPSSPQ